MCDPPIDITCAHAGEGRPLLAVAEGLYPRAIVGWAVSDRPDTALVRRRGPPRWPAGGPGRTWWCTRTGGAGPRAPSTPRASADRRAVLSDGRTGTGWDSAPRESVVAALEKDLVHRVPFAPRADAERAVFEYIEVLYDRVRGHSPPGPVSPAASGHEL